MVFKMGFSLIALKYSYVFLSLFLKDSFNIINMRRKLIDWCNGFSMEMETHLMFFFETRASNDSNFENLHEILMWFCNLFHNASSIESSLELLITNKKLIKTMNIKWSICWRLLKVSSCCALNEIIKLFQTTTLIWQVTVTSCCAKYKIFLIGKHEI